MTTVLALAGTRQQIKDEYDFLLHSRERVRTHIYNIGHSLLEAKSRLGHGNWEQWFAESELPFDVRQAQKYMRAYENRDWIEELVKANPEFAFSLNGMMRLIAKEHPEQLVDFEEVFAEEPQAEPEDAPQDLSEQVATPGPECAHEEPAEQSPAEPVPRNSEVVEVIPPGPGASSRPAAPFPEESDAIPVPHPPKKQNFAESGMNEEQLETSKFRAFYEPLAMLQRCFETYMGQGWDYPLQEKKIIDTLRGLIKLAKQIGYVRTRPKIKKDFEGQLDMLASNENDKAESQATQP